MQRILLIFSTISVLMVSPVHAKTIYGLGMSQSKAGEAFNHEQARASATRFLSEQAKVGHFTYQKQGKGYEIKQQREVRLDNVRVKEKINLPKQGVAVIMTAEAEVPNYTDADCRKSKRFIKNAKQLNDIVGDMLNKTALEIIKSKYKSKDKLAGVSYINEFKIRKARKAGQFIINASICLAEVK